MRNHEGDRGFTLVELLVVMVIIGVLSSIAVPAYAGHTRKAKLASLKAALRAAAAAQEQRAADEQSYATPGPLGVAQLVAGGYVPSPSVELTVVDDAMAGAGGGYCLRAHHVTLAATDDLYYANSGPDSGRPTPTPCAAS